MQFDKIKNDKIKKSDIDTSKKKISRLLQLWRNETQTKRLFSFIEKNNDEDQCDSQEQNQNILEIYRSQKWFEKLRRFVAIVVVVVTNSNEVKSNDILIRVNVNIFEKWQSQMNLMNEIVDINCISKFLTKKWNFQNIDEISMKMSNFDVDNKFSINTYQMKMNVRDDKNIFFISMQKFYSFQNLMYSLIMNFSWMMKSNSHVHWFTMTWRYTVKKNQLKLNTFENFTTILKNDAVSVYALICFIRINDETFIEISIEIKTFENVFFFKSTITLLSHDEHDHVIDLMSNKISLFESLYNMSQTKLKVLQKYIRENLALNRIRHSIVDVDALVLFTLKKNEKLRLCVNYRNLNVVTIKNRISLSFIDETLNRLVEAVYFIKLNLKNAYYRIKIKVDNEWKIAFRTRYELFKYAIMFFELANALTIFQFLMNKIFARLMNKLCVLFLNDILIYFRTKKKYWRHVKAMLKRLWKFNFFVNLIKCKFMQQSIEFLDYIINSKSIFMNMKRIDSIKS